MKILYKCEHCASFYELRSRALRCCDILRAEWKQDNPMVTKYIGHMIKDS